VEGLAGKIKNKMSDFFRATAVLRAEMPECDGCKMHFNKEKYGHECEYPGCTVILCPKCRFCSKHGQCPDCNRLFLVETGHACGDPYCDKLLCPNCGPYCKEHAEKEEKFEEEKFEY